MKSLRYWLEDNWFLLLLVAITVILIALMIWATVESDREWLVFSTAHHCQKIAHTESSISTGYGITFSGKPGIVFVDNPSTTSYKCDDGVVYTREN